MVFTKQKTFHCAPMSQLVTLKFGDPDGYRMVDFLLVDDAVQQAG